MFINFIILFGKLSVPQECEYFSFSIYVVITLTLKSTVMIVTADGKPKEGSG